jgi:two-component system, cell cycle sensor histidine kinase and response regulator CckA
MSAPGVPRAAAGRLGTALSHAALRLGALAVPVLGLSAFLPAGSGSLAALTAGTVLAGLAAAGLATQGGRMLRLWRLRARVRALADHDPAPSFLTGDDGAVLWGNAAARRRFPGALDGGAATLSALAADLFANPGGLVFRLAERAAALGGAAEDVVTRRGHVRLSAVALDRGTFWRLDEVTETRPSTRGAEAFGLPMMIVTRTGAILFMNDALRRTLGGRPQHLDRVFADLPLRSGGLHDIAGADGPLRCRVVAIDGPAGRREVFLLPASPAIDGEVEGIEQWPVALVQLDRTGVIVAANRLARDLLGGGDATGAAVADRLEGLGRPIADWLAEAMAGRGLGRSEVLRVRDCEAERYLQVTLGPVRGPDGVRLVAVLSDATELKTLEAQFVQSQKMQAIGQLAGGVAHDFNNLLTAISGHCDLLLLSRDRGDPDYGDLVQINENSNRAAALVGQLLAFSRKQTLQPQVVDLRDTLSDLTHLLDRLVGERVSLSLLHAPGVPAIRADRRQLEQVIMNLVVNARDAMPAGGDIRISTRPLVLESDFQRDRATVPAGRYAVVRVEDSGIGITPDHLPKIFEPFFTTKRLGEGTGLGLSTAYGIVKQSGGFIFADSVVGLGTTFTVYLPAHAEPAQSRDPKAEAPRPGARPGPPAPPPVTWPQPAVPDRAGTISSSAGATSGPGLPPGTGSDAAVVPRRRPADRPRAAPAGPGDLPPPVSDPIRPDTPETARDLLATLPSEGRGDEGTVLLVEDEGSVRAFAARALRLRGYTVLEAGNGEEALDILEDPDLKVDVFMTDVVMPGLDGPGWVRRALQRRPDARVVFVSGYAEDGLEDVDARVPGSVFLPKPFSLSALTTTVDDQIPRGP